MIKVSITKKYYINIFLLFLSGGAFAIAGILLVADCDFAAAVLLLQFVKVMPC